MAMKVLISDTLSSESLRIFEQAKEIEVLYRPGISHQELVREIADVDALVVRGGTRVNSEVLQAANRLKVVGRAGIGLENMDLTTANHKGVVVMNTPIGSTSTIAEHTIAMLLALARLIPQANISTKQGRWEMNRFIGVDIAGKTLGVIGAGKIGRKVVERALGLRMRVIAYDPYLNEEVIRQLGAELVNFEELLAQADFITMHLPFNSETENILNEEAFSRIKPGCRIINCAIGGLIDEYALAEAIRRGRVAGAALDVFAIEPPDPSNPLLGLDEVICTPHLRGSTVDAQTNVTVQIAYQIVDFLQNGVITNALNVPSIGAEMRETIRPHLALAEKLGSFQSQICARGLKSVTIEYAGTLADLPTSHLTVALLKGLLTPVYGDMVNFVNAPHLAREMGIRVVEARSNMSGGFANSIHLSVDCAEGTKSVWGALFREDDYRIVRVDDYHVEAFPEGHILMLHNDDQPGVIGFIGQVLADNGINIAMMNLSRRKIQGRAISLINVDSRIPDSVLEKLRNNEHIISAVQVSL